ncbi:hypothetical protein ACF058_29990 [Streptomyces sp. NPDC015501]|uniref:hypothetical protein n=1 Tax=unclassified Streptomyces TaxID=2593676 RepID=UPI0036FA22FA
MAKRRSAHVRHHGGIPRQRFLSGASGRARSADRSVALAHRADLLRATVKARAAHRDDRPLLAQGAFDTLALLEETDSEARTDQLAESIELFLAISRLPDNHMDVMVLRHLCGFCIRETSDLLGVPIASCAGRHRVSMGG